MFTLNHMSCTSFITQSFEENIEFYNSLFFFFINTYLCFSDLCTVKGGALIETIFHCNEISILLYVRYNFYSILINRVQIDNAKCEFRMNEQCNVIVHNTNAEKYYIVNFDRVDTV